MSIRKISYENPELAGKPDLQCLRARRASSDLAMRRVPGVMTHDSWVMVEWHYYGRGPKLSSPPLIVILQPALGDFYLRSLVTAGADFFFMYVPFLFFYVPLLADSPWSLDLCTFLVVVICSCVLDVFFLSCNWLKYIWRWMFSCCSVYFTFGLFTFLVLWFCSILFLSILPFQYFAFLSILLL